MVSDGVRQEFANIFRYPMARILSMARIMSTAGIIFGASSRSTDYGRQY